jgi:hypothetical protein
VTPLPPAAPRAARSTIVSDATLGVALVTTGLLWLLVDRGVDVPIGASVAGLLVVVGIGVAASGLRGEPERLSAGVLGFAGTIVAVALVSLVWLGLPLTGGLGERSFTPSSVAALDTPYRLWAGEQVLDLRGVSLDAATEVSVSTVLGRAVVLVDPGTAVTIDAAVGAGSLEVLGERVDGAGLEMVRTAGGAPTDGRFVLEVRVGLGELVVERG